MKRTSTWLRRPLLANICGIPLRNLMLAIVALVMSTAVTYATTASGPKVLICGAENSGTTHPTTNADLNDIKTKLNAAGTFSQIDLWDIGASTPTLTDLQAYDAVLIYSYYTTANPITLGNALASYIDGGGGVVHTMFSVGSYSPPTGNFSGANYQVIVASTYSSHTAQTLGTVAQPSHPIMSGVSSYASASNPYYVNSGNYTLPTGASLIASYSDNAPLIAARSNAGAAGNKKRVDLNFFPVSSSVLSYGWGASSTGGKIMANSLIWVAGFSTSTTPAPTVTSFTPTSGCPGTTSVTITGTDFTGATAVKFGATSAAAYTVNSATQITATVPSGASTGAISVVTPSGTGTSGTSFTVNTLSTAPTAITGTTTVSCTSPSTMLTLSGGSPGTGSVATWYEGGCGAGTAVGTGNSITVSPTTTTTYYVRYEGTCGNSGCASATVTAATRPVQNASVSGPGYCSIQAAINAASAGNTVVVSAGSYAENLTIDKTLTLLGPAGNQNTNPCNGGRAAEAIIMPATTQTSNQSSTSGTIIRLGSSSGHINVTVKGFTIDGHNAALSGGVTLNGVTVHTGAGITNSIGSFDANPGGYDVKMIVQNNIIQNLERYGVLADGISGVAMAGTDVSYNKIDNLPSGNNYPVAGAGRGRGIAFEENHYGTATGNCISRVNVGWQDDNYYIGSTGAGTVVSNNTISSYHRGIYHNLQYQGATDASITNNTVSAESSMNSGTDFGIEISSIQSAVGATVTGNNVSGKKYGLMLWNCPTTGTITVSGGTLSGNDVGIWATNNDPQFGAASASTYTLSGTTVTGGTTGMLVEGSNTMVSSVSGVSFSGQSGDYIKLSGSANNVDATGASFGGVAAGSGLTNAQAFIIEGKITDKLDNSALGLVRLKANNIYVTSSNSIQSGVDAATTGDNVNVAAGTYTESPNVNKSVTLSGAQAGVCAPSRSGSESIISCANGIGVNASNVTINGFTIQGQTSQSGPGFGYAVYMAPSNTGTQLLNNVIQNNVIGSSLSNTGSNPSQVLVSCNWFKSNNNSGPSSGNGIYTDGYTSGGAMSNVTISNNKFSGNTNSGIIMDMVDQTRAGSNIAISTNEFSGNAIAVFMDFISNSSFSSNVVSGSTDATGADLYLYGGVNNFTVSNNFFSRSSTGPEGIYISNAGGANNSGIGIHSNSFSGYSNTAYAIELASGYTGALNATCNWFGSTTPATVAAQVSGSVTYIPYLNSGTDLDANPANGFQPAASCSGSCGTLTLSSAVTPLYPMAGQKIQTIFLNYPSSAQTETINTTVNGGGTAPFAYNWTVSGYNTTFFTNPGTASYAFTPTAANVPPGSNADNLYTFNISANDAQGCMIAPTSKRINVVNPYTTVNGVTKIVVCHKVYNRNVYTTQLLMLDSAQVPAHLAHGDPLGNCTAFTGRETAPSVITSAANEEEQTIVAYPNPTTGAFTLELSAIHERADITVMDMQGKVLMTRSLGINDGLKTIFNLNGYSAGMYLIQVKDGETAYRSRIILR